MFQNNHVYKFDMFIRGIKGVLKGIKFIGLKNSLELMMKNPYFKYY